MSNRVTDKMVYSQGSRSINSARKNLVRSQEQATSGKRVMRPSDDPVASMRTIGLKTDTARNQQLQENMAMVTSVLRVTESALGDLGDVIARAKELSIMMSSTTNQEPAVFESSAKEIDQLFLRAVQIGNSRVGNRYIFGGDQTEKAPFDGDGNYYGDDALNEIEVSQGQRMVINVPGSVPFYGVEKLNQEQKTLREDSMQNGMATFMAKDFSVRSPASQESEKSQRDSKSDLQVKKFVDRDKEVNEQDANRLDGKKGVPVISVLKDLSTALKSNSREGVNAALDQLDDAFDQVNSSRALVGSRMKGLELTQSSLEAQEVTLLEQNSLTEDADALKVFSELARDENALNATLETSKRLVSHSLLDFLK